MESGSGDEHEADHCFRRGTSSGEPLRFSEPEHMYFCLEIRSFPTSYGCAKNSKGAEKWRGERKQCGIEFMVRKYLEGEIDTVEVIYPRFKNTLVQEATIRPVLPLASLREFLDHREATDSVAAQSRQDNREMLIEPDPRAILEASLPFYVN